MDANRVLALGAVGVAILGAALGDFLSLPAEMSAPRRAPTFITALDPNYVAYLKMLATLGPAPSRRLVTARAQVPSWTKVQTQGESRLPEERSIEVNEEQDRREPIAIDRGRIVYPADVVTYYRAPQAEEYWADPSWRGGHSDPSGSWRSEGMGPSLVYGRGWGTNEPTPPPPPRPSGY